MDRRNSAGAARGGDESRPSPPTPPPQSHAAPPRSLVERHTPRASTRELIFPPVSPFLPRVHSPQDELVTCVLQHLAARARSPADLVNAWLTCRRVCALGVEPHVLRRASPAAMAVSAPSWSDGAHRFLKRCASAGNLDACYSLGMIQFYCLEDRRGGATLLARAALGGHAHALHSLSVIHFNGSSGTRLDRDLLAGVLLCAKAAAQGHVEALRELGHCLQDGYGVPRNLQVALIGPGAAIPLANFTATDVNLTVSGGNFTTSPEGNFTFTPQNASVLFGRVTGKYFGEDVDLKNVYVDIPSNQITDVAGQISGTNTSLLLMADSDPIVRIRLVLAS
ncbi:unnamed protein product [Closterium sp. Naga37s-1]|nr:unnamed protein product [Closterium sp. Naga37s-1]